MQDDRITADPADTVGGKHIGENAFGYLPVFQHVAYSRRCPEVIFKYVKFTVFTSDQIDSGNMDINIIGNFNPENFSLVVGTRSDQAGRNNSVVYYLLFVVNVLDE